MAAFTSFQHHHHHHHHPFYLDSSVFLPNTLSTINNLTNNKLDEASDASVTEKNSTTMDSSSIVTEHYKYYDIQSCDQVIVTQKLIDPKMENKRKSKEGSYANSSQSKRVVVKGKKQKKMERGSDEKKKKEEEKKAAEKEDPKGYIHVRARRGQATDSHSLAERVRREKISEKMKLLEAMVPGCEKVTGKALMLDEIINYVQSLQNQVEFLSMKLAYVNPMYYDFGMNLESFMLRPHQDLSSLPSPTLPSGIQECSSPTTANNYHILDNFANSFPLQQAEIPDVLLHHQSPHPISEKFYGAPMVLHYGAPLHTCHQSKGDGGPTTTVRFPTRV
ncbi:hypothetical protein OROGR_029225 [Orobanche gracilis]